MEINYFSSDEVNLFKRWYKLILLFSLSLIYPNLAKTQTPIKYEIETQSIGTTNGTVPFWMRSNQYGSIPLSGVSQSVVARASKDYSHADTNQRKSKLLDWGFGIEARGNAGKALNGQVIQAYAKARLSLFQLKIGRSKDVMGLNGDTTLSSGNFTQSGNSLGIPKIELSIPEYYTVPIFDGIFAFKGNFVHGWLGPQRILDTISSIQRGPNRYAFPVRNNHPNTYFHQKSFYARLGKKDWKLKLYGGFNHQVFWGNEDDIFESWKLSPIKSFIYVVTGKTYGAGGVPQSKIGNQIGSIDIGAQYDFSNIMIMIYRQNFYDVGALSRLANIRDGLNGISFENKNYISQKRNFKWKKFIIELFYSKDQAGYPWSIPTQSGDEDYYNNFFYLDGWSYNALGIGNPLITQRDDARKGQKYQLVDHFINNRIVALHLGLNGSFFGNTFISKITYSRNYGTFGTSIYGNSTGKLRSNNTTNIFSPVNQLSMYINANRPLNSKITTGVEIAYDNGALLNDAVGIAGKLSIKF